MRLPARWPMGRKPAGAPCVSTSLGVYTYELPREYQPGDVPADLTLTSETFFAINDFFTRCIPAKRPADADYFFVPLNLIQFQFRDEDPREVMSHLTYLGAEKNHIMVATGDFSQRSKKNHFGEAYQETYDWLDPFVLLALESTSDLLPGQDIGIIPYNTLASTPSFTDNPRPLLYSFLGALEHRFLPPTHVRSRLAHLAASESDVFIGTAVDNRLRKALRRDYHSGDDHELLARNSVFTLAPAGYGRWSYRFFQAIRWGSIPVLLSDDYIKPFDGAIPYDSFTVTIPEKDLDSVDSILRDFSGDEIKRYQHNLAKHQGDFTKREFFTRLVRRLEEIREMNAVRREPGREPVRG